MTTTHHQVPTHLDVEDKVLFGLTVRQFLYLLVGSSPSYALWDQAAVLGDGLRVAGVVALPGAEFRAVLEITGTANPLEDDAREEGLLAGFATFLNALSYPIQILVRATPVDLSRYVSSLEERGRQMVEGQLAVLAHDHAAFVQGLARQRTLLERRFYVVVPAEAPPRAGWLGLLHGASTRPEH